ncbi:uncharacterized protein LOC128676021 [Plodia interpunctella]|uniref:uncharacterized protein LOC128676021 n=1 Tax=Plodia interpunctella TaxID=58824 RepID=UPI002367F99D|nr:uncharacterized protein LOC128676021 [Plodia interpunctella]
MPLIDITNPDIIKFLIESYDKTARLRMKWNNLYGDRLREAATLNRPDTGRTTYDVFKVTMIGGMPATTRDHISSGYNRKRVPIRDGTFIPGVANLQKGHSIVDVGLGDPKEDPRLARPDTDTTEDPLMRVIDPKETEIIYKDKPVFGRLVYLKHRFKKAPEDKYYFKECSGWDYGWRLKDSFFSRGRAQYGRVWRLNRDNKSRSGPQPDPSHYNSPDIPSVNKCPL